MMFVMMMARTVGQFCKTEEAASRCGSACLKAECQPHYHDDDAENAKKYAENMMMVIFIMIMMRTVIHHIIELDCGLQDCFDLFANMG